MLDVIAPITIGVLPKSNQVEMTEYRLAENKTRTQSQNVSKDMQVGPRIEMGFPPRFASID